MKYVALLPDLFLYAHVVGKFGGLFVASGVQWNQKTGNLNGRLK